MQILMISFDKKKKNKLLLLDTQEDASLAYSNGCNRRCYSSDGFQAFT